MEGCIASALMISLAPSVSNLQLSIFNSCK
jgi:hypothetical protein